jgi:hypothetical protein
VFLPSPEFSSPKAPGCTSVECAIRSIGRIQWPLRSPTEIGPNVVCSDSDTHSCHDLQNIQVPDRAASSASASKSHPAVGLERERPARCRLPVSGMTRGRAWCQNLRFGMCSKTSRSVLNPLTWRTRTLSSSVDLAHADPFLKRSVHLEAR